MAEHLQGAGEPQLDALFYALSDGRRRAMIAQLAEGDQSVKEIAAPLHMALPSAVKHLSLLEDARIVQSEKVGRVRTFKLSKTAFDGLEAWVALRKKALNRQFDSLDAYLARTKPDAGQGA